MRGVRGVHGFYSNFFWQCAQGERLGMSMTLKSTRSTSLLTIAMDNVKFYSGNRYKFASSSAFFILHDSGVGDDESIADDGTPGSEGGGVKGKEGGAAAVKEGGES
ncbi:hypothetical protein Lal_00021833, partial [Lupinus albus]